MSKEVEPSSKKKKKTVTHTSSLPSLSSVPLHTSSAQTKIACKPQAGCEIVPNTLCPLVAASDWLCCWSTPHSIQFKQEVCNTLSPNAAEAAFETIQGAHTPTTKGSYGAGLLCFTQVCDAQGIPETDQMPVSHILLVGFVGTHKGKVSGKTIKSWLSALKAWHDTSHAPWHGDNHWIQMACITANKEGTAFQKQQCALITIKHLHALQCHLNISMPFHTAT
jgi:hypothetical protein